jgi:hypothetical protein
VWTQYRRAAYPRRFVPDDLPPAGSVHRVYREAGPPEERLEAPELYTINIATTHENTEEMLKSQAFQACVGPSGATAAELQRQVRGFRTLNELNTGDARNAFWMGYVLGQAYGQAVVCAKEELSGGKCTAAPPAPALTCRP